MSWAIAVALASAALNGIIGALALVRRRDRAVYRSLAVLGISFSFWSLAYVRAWPEFLDPFWMKMLFTPLSWLPAAALSFVWSFTGLPESKRRWRTWPLFAAGLLALGLLWGGVIGLDRYRAAFVLAGAPVFGMALVLLFNHWRASPPGDERNRRAYSFAASLIAAVGGHTDFLRYYGYAEMNLANVSLMAYSVLVLLAIGRHHLLDLRSALRQAAALIAVSLALGGLLTGLAWLTRRVEGQLFLNFFLVSLALVALLPEVWRRLNLEFTRRFLVVQTRRERVLEEFEARLEGASSLAAAAVAAAEAVRSAWSAGARVQWSSRELRGVEGGEPLPEIVRQFLAADPAVHTLQVLARSESPAEMELAEALRQLGAEAVSPIIREGELAGALLVEKPVEGYYDLAAVRWLRRLGLALGRAVHAVKLREEVLHADRLAQLGTLAAGIAHEVRNPLSAILGAVEILQLNIATAKRDEFLGILRDEVDRLNGTLTELLDYSSAQPRRGKCQWKEVWERLEKLLRPTLPRGLRLESEGSPLELGVSPAHCQQILLNLVKNAMRAAASDGTAEPLVRIQVSREGGLGLISVSDNGPGIAAEVLPRLFTPFSTASPGGTGLGLATVRRLAELYGGRVWAERLPRGTRFVVELPVL